MILAIFVCASFIPAALVNAQVADFQVAATPTHVSIGTDGTAHFVIKVISVSGFSGLVQLAVTGLSTQYQSYASFRPGTLQLAANGVAYSVLTLTIGYQSVFNSVNSIGAIKFDVTGTGNGVTRSTPLAVDIFYGDQSTVQLTDVTLGLQPNIIQTSASVTQSQNVALQLTITSGATTMLGQTLFIATLQTYDIPNGLFITFDRNTLDIIAGQTTTVTMNVLMAPAFVQNGGTFMYAIGITAFMQQPLTSRYLSYQNFILSKDTVLTIIVPPAFNVGVSPTILNVLVGGPSQQLGIAITPTSSGLTDPIVLSAHGLPAGLLATFQTNPLIPNGLQTLSTKLIIQAPSSTWPTTATVQITAQAAGITSSANVSLTIQPEGDYTIVADQTTLGFTGAGQSKTVTLTITPQNGFSSTINMSVLNLPTGFTASFSTTSVQVQQSTPITVIMTMIAGSNIQAGTYSVSVVGNTGVTATKSIALLVLVRAGVGEIWPIILVLVVVIALVSLIVFVGVPRGREVRRIPEKTGTPRLPP
jgi:hypothetical protein